MFALSVLLDLTGRDAGAVWVTLEPHLFCDLRKAIKSLRRRSALLAGIEGDRGSSKATGDHRRRPGIIEGNRG